MLLKPQPYFDADASGNSGGQSTTSQPSQPASGQQQQQESEPVKFETWFAQQPEGIKTMLTENTKNLKSALDSERESRKGLERQVRDMAKNAEVGSKAQQDLEKLANDLSAADLRADFYEKAHGAGISNLKLAYLIAQQDDLIDKRGNVNFEVMKQSYPELFVQVKKQAPAQSNAGAGQNGNPPSATSMNNFIRAAAGRQSQ